MSLSLTTSLRMSEKQTVSHLNSKKSLNVSLTPGQAYACQAYACQAYACQAYACPGASDIVLYFVEEVFHYKHKYYKSMDLERRP